MPILRYTPQPFSASNYVVMKIFRNVRKEMCSLLDLPVDFPEEILTDLTPECGLIKNLYDSFREFKVSEKEVRDKAQAILSKCDAIESEMIACVEAGNLAEATEKKREVFAGSSILKAYILLQRKGRGYLENALRSLDIATFIGTPLPRWDILSIVSKIHEDLVKDENFEDEKRTLNDVPSEDEDDDFSDLGDEEARGEAMDLAIDEPPVYDVDDDDDDVENNDNVDIPEEDCPSVQTFHLEYFEKDQAVKLRNCMTGWAAPVKWKYLAYLKRVAGHRTVPVEIGDYSRNGRVRLVKLADYLNDLVTGRSPDEIGYMAQHQLLNQEPRLLHDVLVPDYCAVSDIEEPMINCWLGPKGTVSPLHYDPQPNILAQVVGTKNIMLYPAECTPFLYPRRDRFFNTSQVDVMDPDEDEFPLFMLRQPIKCTLNPGEMLFIPAGWWHAVESTSTSFSVNFFF